ncbi:MAG: type II secretion system F family protein [Armatimonadota bacterium]
MTLQLIIMALGLTTLILLVVGLMMKTERQIIVDRIHRYGFSEVGEAPLLADDLMPSFTERMLRPALQRLGKAMTGAAPRQAADAVRRRLEAAGNPYGLTPAEFSAVKIVGLLVGAGFGAAIIFGTSLGQLQRFALALLLAGIGYIVPDQQLSRRVRARREEILHALPNTIDLLIVSVEAGLGFDAAMARIVEKTKGPLSEEFGKALREMRMGKTRVDSLRDMARRADVTELGAFVAAVYQAEELGASLTTVLKVQGQMIRSRRREMARETASKLPVKMLFPLLFFIFPSIFIIVLGPGIIQMSKTMFAK